MFITIEGPDGGGKTTQMNLLVPALEKLGFDVVRTREPGGTPIGDQIRSVIMDMKNKSMHPRAEILLFCASRAQLVEELIRPSLAAGKIVLCDRYADSTMAYQGYGHGLDRGLLKTLLDFAMDDYALQFHERVRNGYLKMAAEEPERFVIINADRPKEEIHEEIISILRGKI